MQNMIKNKSKSGFTLVEILVVIGIIAILASLVLIAINPAKQFAQARDTQRYNSLNVILNAIGQRIADNKGQFAGEFTINGVQYICGILPTTQTLVLDAPAATTTEQSGNLGCLTPTYVPQFPVDPVISSGTNTGYLVYQDPAGRIHIISSTTEPTIPRTDQLEIVR